MIDNRIVRYLIYFILLIPALPPIFFPLFQPYTFGKTVLFEIAVELAVLLCLFSMFRDRDSKHWLVLLFFVALGLSTIFGVDPARSFWGSSARTDGLFTLVHFGLFFWMLTRVFNRENFLKFIKFSALVGFGAALYGLAQWIGLPVVAWTGADKISSTLGNSAHYAVYLLFVIFFSIYAARAESRSDWKIFFFSAAALEALVLLMTQSRGAMLGLFVGLVIMLCLESRSLNMFRDRDSKHWAVIVSGAFIIFLLLAGQQFAGRDWLSGASAESRLYIWKAGIEKFTEHPLLGRGANNFEVFAPATGEIFDKPHNIFIEMVVSYGIIGLAAYLFLIWRAANAIWKKEGEGKYALLGLLGAYLTALFFLFDTFSSLLMFFFLLAYSVVGDELKTKDYELTKWRAAAAFVCVMVLFFAFHYRPLHSAFWARKFFAEAQKGIISESAKAKALKFKAFNSQFIESLIKLEERGGM